ncbi:hypothetical protein BcDW1_8036 [Botrytis cinerea BcDW1]|uniref:Uncharacterized protein n=1 Tax=Botryotinia fuckeliana (strain BcDW1) TaxID=1290391 RepID=M7TQE8_BOTF1|nr:hypothetical protein BcDW1_8036 [Botrytis cinerea BcDW1]
MEDKLDKQVYLDQLATESTMPQNPDRNAYYNEGESSKSIERDNSDGSLRCPVFVQDTDEVVDEDGNVYLCWVDEKAWEEEQKARQIAVLASRYASLSEALAESSNITPAVENSSTAMPIAITTANMSSVPSAAAETFSNTPIADESDVHSKPEDNEGALNTDTVEATPSISPNNTFISTFYQRILRIQREGQWSVEGLADPVWDLVGKILFTTGLFMWWIFPEKLRDKLEARHADYLASGTEISSTVTEQKTRLEEDENVNLSGNDAAVPNQGDGTNNLEDSNYWESLGDLDLLNHVGDYTIEAEEEADYSGGKRQLAYLEDAQGKVLQVLFAVADICDQDLNSISDEYMDRLKDKVVRDARANQIFLQTPIILREWKDDDAYDENGHRIFPDVLPGDDDGENAEEDKDDDNGGSDGDDDDDDDDDGEEGEEEEYEEEEEDDEDDEDEEDDWGQPWDLPWRENRELRNVVEIDIPDLWEELFEFAEKCPRGLRISKYSQRRYRRRSGDFRLLLYRG